MTNKITRTFMGLIICGLLLITSQSVVFAQDDYWPYLPTDKDIDDAVASFIKKETFEREVLKCSQIEDYTEKQICLGKRSLYFQMSDEYVYKTEISAADFIKMHHSLQPDPLIGSAVILLYTEKNYVLHKTQGDLEKVEYKTALLQYENGWFFNSAVVLPWDENHVDPSLPPEEKRNARVNLLFQKYDARGYYGYERGFAGEQTAEQNSPPEVHLTFSPKYPTPSDTVELTANATDPDGDPLSYTWLVNEEKIDPTSSNVRMWDLKAGEYWVEVQVSDGKGGTDEDLAVFEVRPLLAFLDLQTGKRTYNFNEAVKVVYNLKNWSEDPVDFYVEYRILDSSKREVFYNKGGIHSIQPGESQGYQSEKFIVPDEAMMGSYEIQAKCISDYGTDEIKGYFTVVSEDIDVSYLLGYEMPFSEQNPVPLRIKFKLTEKSGIVGITSVHIIEQDPQIFFAAQDSQGYVEYEKPGVKEAVFDFGRLASKNLNWLLPITGERTISFVAKIGIHTLEGNPINDYEQDSEIEIPIKVKIKAAFSVCAIDSSLGPSGEIITPLLNGNPLSLDKTCSQPIKGFDGAKLAIYDKTRVILRDLSGAAFSIGDYGGGDTMYWEVTLSQANAKELEQYQMSDSAIRAIIKKQGTDITVDKSLEFLFQKAAKKVSGPLGIFMEILESDDIGGEKFRRAVIKLRSILGVSVSSSGEISIKNYEGNPEIILPDGSTMLLSSGYLTTMDANGNYSEPQTFDTSPVLGNTQTPNQITPSTHDINDGIDDGMDEENLVPFPWIFILAAALVVVIIICVMARKNTKKKS